MLPLSSHQWVDHWLFLFRCTGQKRPPPQRLKGCQQTLVGYQVGGFELGLLPDEQPHADGCEALWGVADADAAYARLLALGAKPLVPVKDVGGGIRVADVLDPFGNRFSIIENPHFNPKVVR